MAECWTQFPPHRAGLPGSFPCVRISEMLHDKGMRKKGSAVFIPADTYPCRLRIAAMTKQVTKSAVKAYLMQRSPEELLEEALDIFARFPVVQDYYYAKLHPVDDTELLKKYKAAIRKEFFPEHGFGKANRSVARKAVADYKKVSGDPAGLADVMLYFVEMGVKFTNEYGDIDEPFYNSMERMFHKALQHLVAFGLQDDFEDRCRRIVSDSAHTGWGFHDVLSDLFHNVYK